LVHAGADVTIIDALIPEGGGNLHSIRDLEGAVRFDISDARNLTCPP
jgi:hypothetical protein